MVVVVVVVVVGELGREITDVEDDLSVFINRI